MKTLQDLYVAPVGDQTMEYDETNHRWRFTQAVVTQYEPFLTGNEAAAKALSISQHIYSYIRHTAITSGNFPFAEWVYSCTADGKNLIKEAMMDQLLSDAESNLDGTGRQARVNFTNGSIIDRKSAREARVDEDAKDLIDDFCLNFNGASIQLSKKFSLGYNFPDDRYDVWGY